MRCKKKKKKTFDIDIYVYGTFHVITRIINQLHVILRVTLFLEGYKTLPEKKGISVDTISVDSDVDANTKLLALTFKSQR
jgi:hypothetical protein